MQYTRDLLAIGTYTLKQVAEITGLGKNTVKAT
jgi:DNA-binding CsgD family transcriptional regulator